MKTKLSVIMCALAVSAFGCGESGGGGGTIDDAAAEASAVTSVEGTADFEGLKTDPDDAAGVAAAFSVYSSLNAVLVPALSSMGALTQKGGGTGGSITADGDTITFTDFSVGGSSGGTTGTITLSGSITVTASMVDGNLNYTVSVSGGGVNVSTTLNATYDAIELDSEGCPTGGSLSIAYSAAGALNINMTATFNACDDVTLVQN